MSINNAHEALDKRTRSSSEAVDEAVKTATSDKKLKPEHHRRRVCRRSIEFHEENKRLMEMFALEID